MQLCAVFTKGDLADLVGEIAPFEVELGRRPRRAVSLGAPSLVELVPGAGLRVRGDARLAWDALGMTIPVVVRRWQVLLAPHVVRDEGVLALAFDPRLEALELGSGPGIVSDTIAQAVHTGLVAQKKKLVWAFGRTLAVRKTLPERVQPPTRFDLAPTDADVEVTESELRLTLRLEASFVRLPTLAERRSA
jgi:hypothetical protein